VSTDYGHWDISLVGKFDPDKHFGFVYQITNLIDDRSYIGCKHLMKYKKGKPVKTSDWRNYCSSSKYLKPDIEKLGKDNFEFRILLLCSNKRNLYYEEMRVQIELGVITTNDFYNANVGGKRFYRPVESYADPEFINKLRKGDFIVTYKGGISNLIKGQSIRDFALENNYDQSNLVKVLKGKRKTHKDVIKMEYLNAKN
jgi:hypothetical protein